MNTGIKNGNGKHYHMMYITYMPSPVDAPSEAWVCGPSLAGTADSNPTGGMNVCCECCVSLGRRLCVEPITRPE